MNYDQFNNLLCYEEFEIQCALTGISKIDVLKEIGHKINDYYFFISKDGIFNWFDLNGNHVEDLGILKAFRSEHIHYDITKCIIPNSVTIIDNYAFSFCKSLKEMTIPNSVTNIGYGAFYNCNSLTSIAIPDKVTSISDCAFTCCILLTSITIPNNVTSIGSLAFCYCKSLKEITIPNSVKNIGYDVFQYCSSLKEVIFKGKTLEEVKQLKNYPFGIEDESIIKCEM